jgi:ComF family protein
VNNWLNIIQNKLLPPRCILCNSPGFNDLDLCQACFQDLPRNLHCCYQCGARFANPISKPQLCGNCLKQSPAFDETHAPFVYQASIRYLVSQLKFHHDYKNARLLGHLLAEHIANSSERPQALIAVPLHPNRYRQRGFNQSIEIARHVAKQLKIPLDLNSCVRIRDTDHQTGLSAKQRQSNLKQAFAVTKPLVYQHVTIIDDVITTGSTAAALATTLKNQGVNRVDVWACARA